MATAMEKAANTRLQAIKNTSDDKRNAYAQHLTPPETARLAVSMFSELESDEVFIKCLDLGAGTGMLSTALNNRYNGHIERLDAVESDEVLAVIFEAEMASVGIPHRLINGDVLTQTPDELYDRVILNPPYKKLAANDSRQKLLPCRSANLYSAFIAVGLSRLADGGELVAIVPRSWMNGDYFAPFRRYALTFFSLDALHIYGSRTDIFSDTKVLQEIMLVKFSNRKQCEYVQVSHSIGKSDEITQAAYPAKALIDPFNFVVRSNPEENGKLSKTIGSVGLCPSTGKVVDFRCRDSVFEKRPDNPNSYPLLYAGNFTNKGVLHPAKIRKPQWYVANSEKMRKQLTEPGIYVVVKRFSSKEEKKRVVASPLVLDVSVAIENHLNFIHAGMPRKVVSLRSKELAFGLTIWLNSTFIDEWFRGVSGSTQVNARDIKAMPCPSIEDLEAMGAKWHPSMNQAEIDEICEKTR